MTTTTTHHMDTLYLSEIIGWQQLTTVFTRPGLAVFHRIDGLERRPMHVYTPTPASYQRLVQYMRGAK